MQGVRGKNQGVLIRLVEQLNAASGRTYDFATCPTQQRDALEHYSAFLFDRGRIDVDRTTVHFVEDRLGRFRIKPLVGSFRVHGPDPAEAFTFTLINVETDPEHVAAELDLLAEAFRAVRDDGRNEDDIILLGDLESDDQHLGQLGKLLGVTALLSGVPTTVRGANLLDNILLDRRATSEFTGRVEVVDMMREFELTMPGAQEISEHLPIWAEFSVVRGRAGGAPGHGKLTYSPTGLPNWELDRGQFRTCIRFSYACRLYVPFLRSPLLRRRAARRSAAKGCRASRTWRICWPWRRW